MISYQSDLKTILKFIGDEITSIKSMQSNVVPSCSLVCPKMHNSPLIFHLFTRSLHDHLWWLVACDGPCQRQPSWPFGSWYPEMWLCYHQRQVGRFGPIWWALINVLGHVKLNPSERNSSSLQASCLDFSSGRPAARGECRQWVGVIYVSTFHMPHELFLFFSLTRFSSCGTWFSYIFQVFLNAFAVAGGISAKSRLIERLRHHRTNHQYGFVALEGARRLLQLSSSVFAMSALVICGIKFVW